MLLGGNLVVLISYFDFIEILFNVFWGDGIFMSAVSLYIRLTF